MLEQALNHPGEFNEITLYPRSLDEVEAADAATARAKAIEEFMNK